MELKYQNLAILLIMAIGGSVANLRVKRISSPELHQDTPELAKFVVSIRSRTPEKFFGDNHYCGGGLLSQNWVLTAAHCVMDQLKVMYMPRMLLVVSGAPQRMRFVRDRTICSPVKSLHVPKNFIMHNTMNIALMRLKKSVIVNEGIAFLHLPLAPPKIGFNYSVLGWGRMYAGGPLASQIYQLDVSLMSQENCNSYFKNFQAGMLCAGKDNLTVDANPCSGDIGSPVIMDYVVVAVVAYPLGCGSKSLPSVYTDVFHGLTWIRQTLAATSFAFRKRPIHAIVMSVVVVVLL